MENAQENDSKNNNYSIAIAQLLELEPDASCDVRTQMLQRINEWIQTDFNRLISVLYRIDVDEDKLKKRLRELPQVDAAEIILDMMLERQAGKRG